MKLPQVEPIIESLPKGPILRKALTLVLRILTGVVIFAGLFVVLGLIGQTINVLSYNPALALGSLMALVVVVVAILISAKILLFRARSILIDNELEYPVIKISTLLLRTVGEVQAIFYVSAGLIAGIMIWFGGEVPFLPGLWQFFFAPGIPAVLLGLGIIFSSFLQAVLGLVFFYLLAELLLLLLRGLSLNNGR